jgi:hypothetical protein
LIWQLDDTYIVLFPAVVGWSLHKIDSLHSMVLACPLCSTPSRLVPTRRACTVPTCCRHLENKTLHLDEFPDDADGLKMLQAARQLFQESGLTQVR